jgi:thiosulfate/3-mercaptopyruvate sulfurtransferase
VAWDDRGGALCLAPLDPIFYCGSGVTACVSLLAHRGATDVGRLYVGSWSGWLAHETE